MTYEDVRAAWRSRSARSDTDKILSLCELRDLLVELPTERDGLMDDFATDYGAAKSTVKDWLHIIGEYTLEQMQRWISHGLRFNHFEKARQYADAKKMTPAALLDFAIDGGTEGQRMTVDQMVSFALGEKNTDGAAARKFRRYFDGLIKLPTLLKWDDERKAKYDAWLKAGWEFFK